MGLTVSENKERQNAAQQTMQAARLQRDVKDDYRKVFLKTKHGRRVLTDLLQHCGVLRPLINIDNEKETIFNGGKQSVGLLLMDMIDKTGYDAIIELEKFGAELTKIGEED